MDPTKVVTPATAALQPGGAGGGGGDDGRRYSLWSTLVNIP